MIGGDMPSAEKYHRLKAEKLPPLVEIAARIRAGESHIEIARGLGMDQQALANRIRNGGYRWDTGETETDARRRELKEQLSSRLLTYREPWMADALCGQVDPELWFPEKGGSTKEAKAICVECPVREDCLQYSLQNREKFGVWGAVTERERHKMLRERAA